MSWPLSGLGLWILGSPVQGRCWHLYGLQRPSLFRSVFCSSLSFSVSSSWFSLSGLTLRERSESHHRNQEGTKSASSQLEGLWWDATLDAVFLWAPFFPRDLPVLLLQIVQLDITMDKSTKGEQLSALHLRIQQLSEQVQQIQQELDHQRVSPRRRASIKTGRGTALRKSQSTEFLLFQRKKVNILRKQVRIYHENIFRWVSILTFNHHFTVLRIEERTWETFSSSQTQMFSP